MIKEVIHDFEYRERYDHRQFEKVYQCREIKHFKEYEEKSILGGLIKWYVLKKQYVKYGEWK